MKVGIPGTGDLWVLYGIRTGSWDHAYQMLHG